MIFVAGALERDSGKTSLTLSLIYNLKERGVETCGFKPLSGHSMWWQNESFKLSIKHGKLFGLDAYKIWKASNGKIPLEILNPADILLSVPRLRKGEEIVQLYPRNSFEWFIAGRFTIIEGGKTNIIFYYRKNSNLIGIETLINKLKGKISRLYTIESIDEYINLHQEFFEKSAQTCYEKIKEECEEIVVEGFNDSVYPWKGVENSDYVIVTAPGHALIYNPEKFFKAVKLFGDPYTKRFYHIFRLVEPKSILNLPILSSKDLSNAKNLAKRYEKAINPILEKYVLKHLNP